MHSNRGSHNYSVSYKWLLILMKLRPPIILMPFGHRREGADSLLRTLTSTVGYTTDRLQFTIPYLKTDQYPITQILEDYFTETVDLLFTSCQMRRMIHLPLRYYHHVQYPKHIFLLSSLIMPSQLSLPFSINIYYVHFTAVL